MQFATLQWPMVQERIAKSKKSSQEPTKVGGKRKASGSARAKGSSRSSKPKLGASGKMSDKQYQKDMVEKLCHICHQPEHVARNCPQNKKAKKGKGGKVAAASGSRPENPGIVLDLTNGTFKIFLMRLVVSLKLKSNVLLVHSPQLFALTQSS
jgi:hypothetical protein